MSGYAPRPETSTRSTPHEFCTLFNVDFLTRGLALYASLVESGVTFRLHVLCMDDATLDLLRRLALPDIVAVHIRELETHDPGLAATKGTRSPVEYCWTSTPALCLFLFARDPDIDELTYLDADLGFFSNPAPIFDELGDGSMLLVPHRLGPEWSSEEADAVGRFNVEWLTFRRDADGLGALRYWRERCIEWCYHRFEDGKFGDQKYLDDFPERFGGVRILEHPGGGVAPWNVRTSILGERDGHVTVAERPLVFFHFSALRLFRPTAAMASLARVHPRFGRQTAPADFVWTAGPRLRGSEWALIWHPYLVRVSRALHLVRSVAPDFAAGLRTVTYADLAHRLVAQADATRRKLLKGDRVLDRLRPQRLHS